MQQYAIKNSIFSVTRKYFSEKELYKKNTKQKISMLLEKNVNWDKLEICKKRGVCVTKEYCILEKTEMDVKSVQHSKWVIDE